MRTSFLPLVNHVCSQLDDTFSRTHRCPCSHLRIRDDKKLPMDQVGKVTEDDTRLVISLNVSKFKPDELRVNIDGRTITVEGKQEVKEGPTYSARSFLRRWKLPENVDVEQIRSTISEDGQLAIEAPKHEPAAEELKQQN
uniref:SHSP domain-containing protein n=1 Tax=Haemonchus contortus TaxID=6289 RepID=A0A7I4XUZ3_HAECO